MIVAGGIAYVGDRVGHQVGRRRLTLFGIRPRYTSTIVAIGTGMLIALSVTLVALLLSSEVRTAFFRMNQMHDANLAARDRSSAIWKPKSTPASSSFRSTHLIVPFFSRSNKGEPVDAAHWPRSGSSITSRSAT